MKTFKKIIAFTLAMAMVAAVSVGATVAYLQDTDSAVNVMTLGNVEIKQHEYERVVKADGTYEMITTDRGTGYKLQEFSQNKPLYPAVGEVTGWDSTRVYWEQLGKAEGYQAPLAGLNNVQDKFVLVENTGKSDAYVRTIIAYEVGTATDAYDKLIMNNWCQFWAENKIGVAEIDGNNYYVVEYIYNGSDVRHIGGILPAGEYTYNSLAQVYLKPETTNEDVEAIDGNKNGLYDILVFSQAVQVEGFADAQTALNTAFGEITTANHPWVDVTVTNEIEITEAGTYDIKDDVYTIDTGYAHTQKITEDLTINGNGNTIHSTATSVEAFQWEGGTIPAMSTIFSSADGSKVIVNDLNFTGTMSALMLGHYQNATYNKYNTELNNVNVIDAEVVSFSNGISPAVCVYGTAVLNDCEITGTTLSALDTDPMWPVYDLAVVNYTDTTLNSTKVGSIIMWNQAKLTVAEGSEVDTIVILGNMNTTKYGLTIKAGATVGAIDLSAIADKARINITIEDGATVGKIIANGAEYDSLDAWKSAQ